MRTFVTKSAYGVAVMVAGFALSAAGYAGHGAARLAAGDASSAIAWRVAIAGPPAVAAAVAYLLSFRVRVGRARH